MTRIITLSVNDLPVEIDYFVQGFIDHTASGMISSLEGTGTIKTLNISIEKESVSIILNNAIVPVNPFVSKLVRGTIVGLASSLKGVSEINKVNLNIRR
jgi:hypothetical protein